jgi:hypothetical protein
MPAPSIFDASTLVADLIEELAGPSSGPPWAWPSSVFRRNLVTEPERWAIALYVDRDRSDLGRAKDLAERTARRFAELHPDAPPLSCFPTPARFVEDAVRIVDDHFDICAHHDEDEMRHNGEYWVRYMGVERVIGWTPADDRIVVEMYAESSADEGNAQRLGERWLADLATAFPHHAALVTVRGSSH